MYNSLRYRCARATEDSAIDQELVEQGLRLTVIGIGTAFAVLLLLTLVIVLVGRFAGPGARKASAAETPAPAGAVDDPRDKALAAVVAVSAALEGSGRLGDTGGGGRTTSEEG